MDNIFREQKSSSSDVEADRSFEEAKTKCAFDPVPTFDLDLIVISVFCPCEKPLSLERRRFLHPPQQRQHRQRDERDHQAGGAQPAARFGRILRDQRGEATEDRGGGGGAEREAGQATLAAKLLGGGDRADRADPARDQRQQHRAPASAKAADPLAIRLNIVIGNNSPFELAPPTIMLARPRRSWHRARTARCGRLAQLVERLLYTEDVGGSSPSAPTTPSFQCRVAFWLTLRSA